MDALALLCTLYAEGPVTLARLRQADCATIEQVIAMDASSLARILPGTEPTAQRLQREARNLCERLGEERNDAPLRTAARPTSSRPSSPKPTVLDRVLQAWRERDAQDEREGDFAPEEHETHDAGSLGQDFHEPAHVTAESAESVPAEEMRIEILKPAVRVSIEERERAAAISPALQVGVALQPGIVDGLDGDSIRELARVGVRDLRTLATCDALDIARKSGIAWSRLNRLRALAARSVGPAAEPPAAARSVGTLAEPPAAPRAMQLRRAPVEEKVSPSDRPNAAREALSGFERVPAMQHAAHEGAGGPFA